MANAITSDVSLLNDNHRAFLANLPPQLGFDIEGCNVLLVHGSPKSQ